VVLAGPFMRCNKDVFYLDVHRRLSSS